MWIAIAILLAALATPAAALDGHSKAADWVRASPNERAVLAMQFALVSKGDEKLAAELTDCLNAATKGESDAVSSQPLAELGAACLILLKKQREGEENAALDRALGPAASPENLALINLPMPRLDKLIGVWISHYMGGRTRIAIFERGGKVWMEQRETNWDKGLEKELVRTKQGKKLVFREKDPPEPDVEDDLHWVMTEDGSLEQHAEGQVDETVPIAKR